MLPPVLTILLGTLGLSFSYAQKPTVHFDLGFSGEVVTGRWNPVRVELRDINEAELEIHIDQGVINCVKFFVEMFFSVLIHKLWRSALPPEKDRIQSHNSALREVSCTHEAFQ